jgi:hypothetical protein
MVKSVLKLARTVYTELFVQTQRIMDQCALTRLKIELD